ncbi:cation:dicarboxylate symporter family transporter [Streptomyces scabichelini]|uniref:cation:dicarboxylate symporter family transporter n=1 Tax=Streptomyces scabichelini TaxID=2711217 RepID=UPI001F49D723|nr:cation:dicarboxylase symporter family transporter [Streptomyces scabichelini]
MEPIGTTFITAMKMLIGPIVFLTIIGGIAGVADLKKVGRTGIKALTYFQVGTIVALLRALVAIDVFRLGDGVHANDVDNPLLGSAGTARRAPAGPASACGRRVRWGSSGVWTARDVPWPRPVSGEETAPRESGLAGSPRRLSGAVEAESR